ncbi:MAG: glycosyltransferase family 4 protein [Pirellulales bacterium]
MPQQVLHRRLAPSVASRTRRVLHVITPSHMSGAEMQVVRITRRMEARGHELSVVVKRGSSAIAEFERQGVPIDARAISGKASPLALLALRRACRDHRPDLLHSHLSSASWWCGWLERLGGPKTVGHVHGFTSAMWHRQQSHLLAVSSAVKLHLVEQGIAAEKITVLQNALGPEEFVPRRSAAAVRAEFGAEADTLVIGTIAHLSEKKGYRELFQAIPRVLMQFPQAQFWIVGQGPLRDELEQQAREGGVLSQIRFAGFRRDAADIMNAMDVLALPSHREPCALVYIEAALSEKPIVACRAGGAPESIADGQTGLLVPPRDSRALAEAILRLADNRGEAQRMGRAGRARAIELFSWDRYIATLEGVYDRVCSERPMRSAA